MRDINRPRAHEERHLADRMRGELAAALFDGADGAVTLEPHQELAEPDDWSPAQSFAACQAALEEGEALDVGFAEVSFIDEDGAEFDSDARLCEELYLAFLSRYPSRQELATAVEYLGSPGSRQQAAEDLAWSLLNSTEFIFNH